MPPSKCKLPTWVGQQRKFSFLGPLKQLLNHSENTSFSKSKHKNKKHKQSITNSLPKNMAH